ncbi:MAG: hypothetical protein AAGB11_19070, partial [Pseudomonadota bacterium]
MTGRYQSPIGRALRVGVWSHRKREADEPGLAAGSAMGISKWLVLWTLTAVSLITLSLPTLIVIGASFTAGDIIAFPPDGFSLRWYGEMWEAERDQGDGGKRPQH